MTSFSLTMNNNCYIDSVSAVMNARVIFSVILLFLAVLPRPSICQDVAQNNPYGAYGGYTAYGYNRQDIRQNGSSDQNNNYSARQEAPRNRPVYYSEPPPDLNNNLNNNNSPRPNRPVYNSRIDDTDENRPANSRDCFLPEQPEGGRYELRGCNEPCNKRPNDLVPEISVLTYTCKNNYILSGNNISVCINQRWTPPPSCLRICSALRSTSVDISCNYKGETVSCTKHVLPGTKATLDCKPSYTLPSTNDPAYREITCLEDGLWDNRIFRCLPECGTSIAHGNTLIVNGLDAKVGVFPWHVGIYMKKNTSEYEQICGGTLISSNLVISAAHCFYDETFHKVIDASNYAVGAGKYYRDWDTREDYAQKSLVESIQTGDRYLGLRGNFANDIALLKLKRPFRLTTLVRPVCMDWSNQYEREQLQMGQTGKVVGWGKDITGESTKNLQEIEMPFVPYHQCLSAVPRDFRGYLTSDKFCAGHLNGSSVCDGDSGGGICFEKNGIWYLRGVVSVSPSNENTCDYNSYVGFTYISHSREWIRQAYTNA